jgi:diacylglycerol kinase family enzyme
MPAAPIARSRPIQIIVTPGSGDGHALSTAEAVRDRLHARRYPATLKAFEDLNSLERWASVEHGDPSLLICVGGDSTQSTTAMVALRRSVPFLPVSRGFGNLFAHAIDAPESASDVLDRLDSGQVLHVDVGTRNGELFLCQESYGLIADVQADVEARGAAPRARWQRWLAYYGAAIRYLRSETMTRRRVVVDGRVVALNAALVIVANVTAYGPWLPLTPSAPPVDGLFDVFVMWARSPREVIMKLLRRHLRIPGAAHGTLVCRGRRVRVSAPGEPPDRLEVVSGGLPVVVSPATATRFARERSTLQIQEVFDGVAV